MLLLDDTTMNKLRAKYHAWRQRRRIDFVRSWALRRTKGKKRFLALCTIGMTLFLVAVESWKEGVDGLPFKVVASLVISLVWASIAWRENERAYRRHLNTPPKADVERSVSTREA